jgi:hypothetical protein
MPGRQTPPRRFGGQRGVHGQRGQGVSEGVHEFRGIWLPAVWLTPVCLTGLVRLRMTGA